jgi:hypothetical protein
MALDRLVSIQDHADFARTFAGVGKACATRLAVGQRLTVYLTIGGTDESPLDASSAQCRNLADALSLFGDPHQPALVIPAEAVLAVIVAKVRVDPDYEWASVEGAVRAALVYAFGFAQRDLGQDLILSEVISVMQSVPGVDYVDVDLLERITAATLMTEDLDRISKQTSPKPRPETRLRSEMARLVISNNGQPSVQPAQIVYLSGSLASLLTLTELTT